MREDLQLPPVRLGSDAFARFFLKYTTELATILCGMEVHSIRILVDRLRRARSNKKNIFLIGNGGSAATASHFANDLAKERFADAASRFRVQSLTDNVPWLTCAANDFGYESIFLQQLKNLLNSGDLVIAISSSGNSPNILRAVEYANDEGAITFGIVGFGGGDLRDLCTELIDIPSKKGQYGYMEDACSVIIHLVSVFMLEQDRLTFGAEI